MTLYMKTTTDKYELPIAVADSPKKLAMMLGQKRSSVATMCSQQRNGYHRIEVEPDECPAMIEEQNMEMTKKEICRNYLGAKKKRAQIEILADLNNTDKATIKEILKEGMKYSKKKFQKQLMKYYLHFNVNQNYLLITISLEERTNYYSGLTTKEVSPQKYQGVMIK